MEAAINIFQLPPDKRAVHNMHVLGHNQYPGRGIVLGLSEDGKHLIQLCWIMGRSEGSRNRVYKEEGGRVYTEPAREVAGQDKTLIIYNAMDENRKDHFVVSNGKQTDDVIRNPSFTLEVALEDYEYEPDAPHYTPRITGSIIKNNEEGEGGANIHLFEFAVFRRSPFSDHCHSAYFTYSDVGPGLGYCVHTYMADSADGVALPSFEGEPFLVPLKGSAEDIVAAFRSTLNQANMISIAVKFIPVEEDGESVVTIWNKYEQVQVES